MHCTSETLIQSYPFLHRFQIVKEKGTNAVKNPRSSYYSVFLQRTPRPGTRDVVNERVESNPRNESNAESKSSAHGSVETFPVPICTLLETIFLWLNYYLVKATITFCAAICKLKILTEYWRADTEFTRQFTVLWSTIARIRPPSALVRSHASIALFDPRNQSLIFLFSSICYTSRTKTYSDNYTCPNSSHVNLLTRGALAKACN